jgi:hypothetical protein
VATVVQSELSASMYPILGRVGMTQLQTVMEASAADLSRCLSPLAALPVGDFVSLGWRMGFWSSRLSTLPVIVLRGSDESLDLANYRRPPNQMLHCHRHRCQNYRRHQTPEEQATHRRFSAWAVMGGRAMEEG